MPKTTHLTKVQKFIPTSEPVLDGNEKKYVLDTLERNWISAGGKYSQLLEEKFAKWNSPGEGFAGQVGFSNVRENQRKPELLIKYKKTEQTHFSLGYRTFSFRDPRKYNNALCRLLKGLKKKS